MGSAVCFRGSFGDGSFPLSVWDPYDGHIVLVPNILLVFEGTGARGYSEQTLQVTAITSMGGTILRVGRGSGLFRRLCSLKLRI